MKRVNELLLTDSEVGKNYKITNVDKLGRKIRKRLYDMGLGNCVFLVVVKGKGPILLEVRETRLAIGRGMAMKIEVEEIGE